MHFNLLVVGPNIEQQLEPFEASEMNNCGYWDWYEIGGRWSQSLKLLPGRGLCGDRSPADGPEDSGWVDQALKGDIDWDGMRATAEQQARTVWRKAREITGGQTWLTWETITAPIKDLEHTDFERWIQCMQGPRRAYSNQPAVKALHEAGYWYHTDLMALDEEEYVQLCPGLVTFAYLLNGEWHAKPWSTNMAQDRTWQVEF